MIPTAPIQHPRPGMLATIRNRRGLIAAVEPFDSQEGRLHLVRVEYTDSDGVVEDTVLWEREHGRDLLEPNALPQVQSEASMEPREFDALVRAARWAALTPFLHPDGSGRAPEAPISAPFFGAVQVDDFPLVPLLKALEMPRVSLLLADDTRSRPHSHGASDPTTCAAGSDSDAGLTNEAVARGDEDEVLSELRSDRPRRNAFGSAAPRAGREPLAHLPAHYRVLLLPAPARHPAAVSRDMPPRGFRHRWPKGSIAVGSSHRR